MSNINESVCYFSSEQSKTVHNLGKGKFWSGDGHNGSEAEGEAHPGLEGAHQEPVVSQGGQKAWTPARCALWT